MKAKIGFDFYHDGVTPTRYEPGDEVPGSVAVPPEWLEDGEPAKAKDTTKPTPKPKPSGKKGK